MADRTKPAAVLEVEARAVNATDWQPLPGMVKRRCLKCRFVFAVKAEHSHLSGLRTVADAEAVQQLKDLIAANAVSGGSSRACRPVI